ncbi:hypothetical protein PV409_36670 [Streptomyces sp. ME02-6979.5a]|uniref:hypothetical protein n=1 Tax=Streptomyces sp. ME02-6979.5a TaxID=462925 RepID=UPI0029AB57B5|nr:hypothetical protein [Streptomyces sp. ME02-6979.5a]MDX3343497.1 hypothetical protein [Streptomyces sp. ME02-6979.5a]
MSTNDIGVMLADIQRRLAKVEAQSRLKSASLDDTALLVRDSAGSLRGIVGQQGDGTTAVNVVNGAPPPAPTTPTAAPALGGVSAGWDGTFADEAIIPLDWARIEVHASPDDGFTPDPESLVATIETAQGGIVYIPATVPQYVRLVARNTSGAASPATAQVGPYAPKPVAGEIGVGEITETLIADGAVTTPKVYANAITTALLAAGAVDATALKADAITGKTITGGVINGAEFHSDDGAGGLVDIESGTVVTTAATGWKILIDPTQAFPVLDFLNDAGITAGSINAMGDSTRPGLVLSSGPFTDGAVTDWRWATRSGADGADNGWRTGRFRESDLNTILGGYINLAPDRATVAWIDTDNSATNTILQITQGVFTFDEGRFVIDPPVSSNSSLWIVAKSGHTGRLIRAQVNSVDQFVVTAAGAVTAAGQISAPSFAATGAVTAGGALSGNTLAVTDTTWSTYTPTVSGGGTATYSTRTGFYYKIGKIVYIHIYIACSAAGSGSTGISVTLPSVPYRGSADIRQYLPLYAGGILPGSNSATGGTGIANINPGGSGTDIDQLRSASDIQYRGTNLSNTATFTIQGWYREA